MDDTHIATAAGVGVAVLGNSLAWAQSTTVGTVATAITVIGTAAIGITVLAYSQIGRARTKSLADYDELFAKSLQGRLADREADLIDREQRIVALLADRQIATDLSAEARADRAELRKEIEKLRGQIGTIKADTVSSAAEVKTKADSVELSLDRVKTELKDKGVLADTGPDLPALSKAAP